VGEPVALKILLWIASFILIMGFSADVQALGLDISVTESLTGHAAVFSLDNGPAQVFNLRWENIGSVNCRVRPRIDFYQDLGNGSLGERVYISWGSEDEINSGASHEWELLSSLPEGEYAAILRVTHCHEIFSHEPFLFSSPSHGEENLEIQGIEIHPDFVDVIVEAPDGSVIIPEEFPRGWIFEGSRVEQGRSRLGFVPVNLEATSVTLKVIGSDGSVGLREFSMKPPAEEFSLPWGTYLTLLFMFIFLLYVSRNIIKIWRR
jgi:hypothetical protein